MKRKKKDIHNLLKGMEYKSTAKIEYYKPIKNVTYPNECKGMFTGSINPIVNKSE